MNLLNKAIILAVRAHEGQHDKGGAPYIQHPLRVMMQMNTDEERIVAVLHDVIEDSNLSPDDLLSEGFSVDIRGAVIALTRRTGESYMDFIRRCKEDELARKVKIADLEDNLDISRITDPSEEDFKRIEKYKKALTFLRE